MKNLLQNIHETNRYGIGMKAILKPFNAHLMRWYNDDNLEHYNQNFYTATAPLTREDISAALDYQKQTGVHHLLHYVLLHSILASCFCADTVLPST